MLNMHYASEQDFKPENFNTFKTHLSLSPENYTLEKPTSRGTDLYHIEQHVYFKVKILLLVRQAMQSYYMCVIHTPLL